MTKRTARTRTLGDGDTSRGRRDGQVDLAWRRGAVDATPVVILGAGEARNQLARPALIAVPSADGRFVHRTLEFVLLDRLQRFANVAADRAVNPGGVMSASTRLAECLVRDPLARAGSEHGLTPLRFGNVLGSRGNVVPRSAIRSRRAGRSGSSSWRRT